MIDAAEAARPNKKSKVDDRSVVKPPVPGKGLKHFSLKICERVKSMGSTSYNEVADLVSASSYLCLHLVSNQACNLHMRIITNRLF